MENAVTLLGVRGSMSVSGEAFLRYGGATTSILVELEGVPVLVDAGTGIMNLPGRVMGYSELTLLLSHPHVDHPRMGKIPWRRKWQPAPVLLPGEFLRWRSGTGCSPWNHRVGHDCATNFHFSFHVH